MKVLIVKASALGDVVHALPALAWIRSADPRAEIHWLVEESFAPLLEGHPWISQVHRLATKAWRRQGIRSSLRGVSEVIAGLRRQDFDLALDLQGNSKSALFTRLSGAPLRFGFNREGVREWPNLLGTNRKVRLLPEEHHVSDRSLAIARAAFPSGAEPPLAGPLAVDGRALAAVDARLRERELCDRTLVVLHYGTTWTTKLWPLDSWRNLVRRLAREENVELLMTWGSEEEREAAEAIREAAGGKGTVWPRGSLQDLAALLQRADLVVGGDTGPIHMAAALGTPTLSLFRVTDAARNGPRGPGHLCLQAPLDCSPCLRKECERDEECGRSLPVDRVFESVRTLLNEVAP